jgi:multiple sugar transport system ATP-binding protein
MARVALRNVSKDYGGERVHAVRAFSLDVSDGEFVVLLGPSGCGKTTTLRLVAGLERLTAGTIEIGDTVVNRVSPRDRDVAMVFQDFALYPHMSVFENLAFGLKMRRRPKVEIRERVGEIATRLRIGELLDRRPHELSGGEQQRVAFGRAIVRRPKVCLFDEPLASLDVQLRVEMRRELKRHQRELGMTSLYVTHDQQEAMSLGDRIVVMRDGRVVQVGSPGDVYRRPVDRFVAGFIGTPAMNFLDGCLLVRDGGLIFECRGGSFAMPERFGSVVGGRERRPVVVGIRPDHVRLGENGSLDGVEVSVGWTESLGDYSCAHCTMSDGQAVVSKICAMAGDVSGHRVRLVFDMSHAVIFSSEEDGLNLVAVAPGAVSRAS